MQLHLHPQPRKIIQNPNVVVNNIDAVGVTPAFLNFSGGQGRAFTGRLRFLGRR